MFVDLCLTALRVHVSVHEPTAGRKSGVETAIHLLGYGLKEAQLKEAGKSKRLIERQACHQVFHLFCSRPVLDVHLQTLDQLQTSLIW